MHILGQSWGGMLAVEYLLTQQPPGVVSLRRPLHQRPGVPGRTAPLYLAAMLQMQREAILDAENSGDYSSMRYQEAMNAYYHRYICWLNH